MNRHRVFSVLFVCGLAVALLVCPTRARADLLGYWSANSPNDDFVITNDHGNADLNGELFGGTAYGPDASGVTGQAGDFALEFFGTDEDYAAIPPTDVTLESATIAAWVNGVPNGDWAGIVQSRDSSQPIGIGYSGGAGAGRLSYTWNDNNSNSWAFARDLPNGDFLQIPEDEWTFVAVSLTPTDATLFVGPQGGQLVSAMNEIPHLAQTNTTEWRMAEDNCCGTERNFLGSIDDVAIWDHALLPQELAQLHAGTAKPTAFLEPSDELRQRQVAGTVLGTETLTASLSDIVKGDPVETEGLAQFWYEGNMRANPEAFLAAGDQGSAANPLATASPFASNTTWWAGSQSTGVISDLELPRYPDGLAGTRFEGSTDANNYGVRLTGEIFIPEDGEYVIRDGIDDFAMIAIDQDGNGELDELDTLTAADVGLAGFGDILVLDDDLAGLDGSSQSLDFHGFAIVENIAPGGAWRKIDIWMSEQTGDDGGIVYMGNFDDPDIFDDTMGGALSQEERDAFVIRNDQLRSTVSVVESATASAELRPDVEYVLQVSTDGNDRISIDDNGSLYNTVLNVTDATVRVQLEGDLEAGTAITLFDADSIMGLDTLTLLFDDESLWDLSNIAMGQVIFGAAPMIPGDIDGNGTVAFADFLILSTNFGLTVDPPGSRGDIDGNGTVAFSDFLILSTNFGRSAGADAAAQTVPEPSGLAILSVAGLALCGYRRRRTRGR